MDARTFHCPRWPGCCPDGAVRNDCPALADMMRPDRRDTDNCAADHDERLGELS